MKKYSKQDQKVLAIWAADCAEHVLPFLGRHTQRMTDPAKP
jgi:hypothetical protein